jgi:nitrite reductase/ring-hydroxylating ferredoxin subunit
LDNWHATAHESDIPEGQAIAFRFSGHNLLLVRSDGGVFAIDERCSHADQELGCGIIRNGWIACPAHGTRFDLATGEPLNPPASKPVATYPLRIRDGIVEVRLPDGSPKGAS